MNLNIGDIITLSQKCPHRPGEQVKVIAPYFGMMKGWVVRFKDGEEMAIWQRHVA